MVHRTWRRLDAQGDVPPPKYLPAIARKGDRVYMFGGLYRGEKRVFPTPCTFSYDLAGNRWTYHHAVPPPYQETGLWGASAFYDAVADVFYILGGLVGWPFGELMDFLAGFPADWQPTNRNLNENVYLYRPDEGKPAGLGAQPRAPGQPGKPGRLGQPGGEQPPPPKNKPDYPEEQPPYLKRCLLTDALDEAGQPVNVNPTFTAAHDVAYFGFKMSPLCDEVSFRGEVYDAGGSLHYTFTGSTVDPDKYGVDCIREYAYWQKIPLGPPEGRVHGNWWIELYINGTLSCTSVFEVEG
jgi:hypothetical protein